MCLCNCINFYYVELEAYIMSFHMRQDSAHDSVEESGDTPAMSMPQRIANELLETEKRYVQRLHIVDQVLQVAFCDSRIIELSSWFALAVV